MMLYTTTSRGQFRGQRLGRKQENADSFAGSQMPRTVLAGSENWRTSLYILAWCIADPPVPWLPVQAKCLYVSADAQL